MILFLTSSPTGAYRSGAPAPFKGFDPANGLAQELRRNWKEHWPGKRRKNDLALRSPGSRATESDMLSGTD